MLRYIIIFSLFLFVTSAFAQKSFESLSKERVLLLETYEAKPKKAIRAKIDRLEDEILEYIQTNGYPIIINTITTLDVQDKTYPLQGNVIATLEDKQEVLLLDKDRYGYYKIKVNDQIGYVYNLKMTPSMETYPLNLIEEGLVQKKAVDDLTDSPSAFRIRYECPSVVCGANTPAGESCKVQTRNCNGRCHLH